MNGGDAHNDAVGGGHENDDVLAAEIALGLVRDDAQASDAALMARVTWWRDHFAALDDDAQMPPATMWARIAAQLPANDNSSTVRRWQLATGGMGLIAASLLSIVIARPLAIAPPVPAAKPATAPAPAPMLAVVAGPGGSAGLAYDRIAGTLAVAPTTLTRGGGDPELWIIPVGGTPHSLGIVDPRRPAMHHVPLAMRGFMQAGATLAISREALGGSPTGAPQGPVIASGTIIRI